MTLSYYWDEQFGVKPGWYVELRDAEGTVEDDSMKVWFPVDVDEFTEDQETELVAALREAFPDAEISEQ